GTHVHFREWPQRVGKNKCVPARAPGEDGSPGAVWTYRRHAGDYPWNLDAVSASSAGDVVARGLLLLRVAHDLDSARYSRQKQRRLGFRRTARTEVTRST